MFDVSKFDFGIAGIKEGNSGLIRPHNETIEEQVACRRFYLQNREQAFQRIFWPQKSVDMWKVSQLSAIVDWAFSTTKFYRELYSKVGYQPGSIRSISDFESLPVITRKDLIESFPEGLRSSEYSENECKWSGSSGSSGQPVTFWLQPDRTYLDTLFRYRQFEFMSGYRIAPSDWMYNIHPVSGWYSSLNSDFRVFSVSQECPPEAVAKHIKRLRPQFISLIASYLPKLAETAGNLSSYGVRLISTNSEPSSFLSRRELSGTMGVPILDEYSSEELDLIASECPHGQYHVVEDETHVEIVDMDESGVGKVIGTDLWNFATPILRYEQGDLAKWSDANQPCMCGSNFRILDDIHGRSDDVFYSLNGAIPTGSLLDVCEEAFNKVGVKFRANMVDPNVSEFRLVQKEYNAIQVLIVRKNLDEPVSQEARNSLLTGLRRVFDSDINVDFNIIQEMPKTSNYKRKVLISEIDKVL